MSAQQSPSAVVKAAATLVNYFGAQSAVVCDKAKCEKDQKDGPSSGISTDPVATSKKSRFAATAKLSNLKTVLPVSYGGVNSSSNIFDQVIAVDPSNSVEWSSVQALYDEYRVVAFTLDFQRLAGGITNPTVYSDALMVLAYDTTDNTVLSGTRNGAEASQHKLYAAPNAANGADVPMYPGGMPHRFHVTLPKKSPLVVSSSNTVVSYPGAWKSITSNPSPAPDGFIKAYYLNNQGNTTQCIVAGILYYHCEFRRRK